MEPECQTCQRRREQRRLRQVHKYSSDEAYRHHRLKVCGEAYHRNPDIGRARSYLRQYQLGRIRRPNADLLQRSFVHLPPRSSLFHKMALRQLGRGCHGRMNH